MILINTKINEDDGLGKRFLKMTATYFLTLIAFGFYAAITALIVFFAFFPFLIHCAPNFPATALPGLPELFWVCLACGLLEHFARETSCTVEI